ncbi:hypothetical protein BDP55DRAFT_637981 [Colletotrichum godetiae]|uniref:Uncharacterized protein n=1 Tax=Colletotrichum godetiae TaxID=1209918 RepID=A0AAJ0A894_9PEZI|nr:uncharacterized protein BDP55DRAFT_637981 [Colletotrichum godetiae]KAK1658356.1 hypothetical protein BDP55DRAFT_637981 [Colletotrichum godetiae]
MGLAETSETSEASMSQRRSSSFRQQHFQPASNRQERHSSQQPVARAHLPSQAQRIAIECRTFSHNWRGLNSSSHQRSTASIRITNIQLPSLTPCHVHHCKPQFEPVSASQYSHLLSVLSGHGRASASSSPTIVVPTAAPRPYLTVDGYLMDYRQERVKTVRP